MDVDMWASSLPPELLVEIFRHLESAAALHCTGVCKPWRRAIVGNAASCLRPRPNCFVPGLLLGFLQNHRDRGRRRVLLQRLPGPSSESAPATAAASSFEQGAAATDLASYDELLSSRDGLVLLGGTVAQDLCLRSLMTGDLKFIPAGAFKACTCVLLTGYDLIAPSDCSGGGGDDDDLRALILAVKETDIVGGMTYQIFSTSDGAWGAVTVTRSHRLKKGPVTRIYHGSEVICRGGAVHWLATMSTAGVVECAVAVDVRSGRTWLTELPKGCRMLDCHSSLRTGPLHLATSGDGRLSVVRSFEGGLVEVWVLTGGDRWARRRTLNVQDYCRKEVWFSAFCPRSGYMLGHVRGKDHLLVHTERGSCCLIDCIDNNHGGSTYSFEMDWSTYLSKIKHF